VRRLHHDLGSLHLRDGDEHAARRAFHTATCLYPFCPRPLGALASLMSSSGRHRAALRHYEAALRALARQSGGQDRNIARAAALGAADCVLALHGRVDEKQRGAVATVTERAELVAGYLRSALAAAPGDDDDEISEGQEMLRRIDELVHKGRRDAVHTQRSEAAAKVAVQN
jgi:hypothetical protein